MARARNIKPAFFKNEFLATKSPEVQLLFIALWTLADREGRLEDRPLRIKAEVFPYTNVDVDAGLNELAGISSEFQDLPFIIRYQVGGRRYIQIVNWSKHQNPHQKELASTIPGCPEPAPNQSGASLVPAPNQHQTDTEPAPNQHKSGRADSLNLIPDSPSLVTDSLSSDSPSPQPVASATNTVPPEPKPGDEPRPTAKRVGVSNDDAVDVVACVFARYQHYHPNARLTTDRVKLIKARLKEGHSPETLCEAIDGLHVSPFHLGENDRNTKYLDLEHAMRNGAQVTKMAALARDPPKALSRVSLFNRRAASEFLEDFDRFTHDGDS